MTTELATTAFISVPFHGDTILAVQRPDGTVYVSINHVCDSLGIETSPQQRKLRDTKWATMIIMNMVDPNGRLRETSVIAIINLSIWLATINPGKVAIAASRPTRPKPRRSWLNTFWARGQA